MTAIYEDDTAHQDPTNLGSLSIESYMYVPGIWVRRSEAAENLRICLRNIGTNLHDFAIVEIEQNFLPLHMIFVDVLNCRFPTSHPNQSNIPCKLLPG